jgi:hypothetical protein
MNLLRQSSKARTSRHQPTKYDVKGGSLGRPAFLLRVSRMKVFSKLKEEFFKIFPPDDLFFRRAARHRKRKNTSNIFRTYARPVSVTVETQPTRYSSKAIY